MLNLLTSTKATDVKQAVAPTSEASLNDIVTEGRFRITPRLAERIYEEAHFAGQRKQIGAHVKILAEEMRRGFWMPGSQIAFCRLGGKLYLVNGGHRMLAVAESGKPQDFQVIIHDVPHEDAIAQHYWVYDRQTRSRTTANILSAANVYDDFPNIRRILVKSAYAAMPFLGTGLREWRNIFMPVEWKSDQHKRAALELWQSALAVWNQSVTLADVEISKKFRTAGATAVALATCRYQPELALEFWSGVYADDGLRRTDPRHTLAKWGAASTGMKDTGTAFFTASTCAAAWNAYYAKQSLQILRTGDPRPLAISGTPFKGK
jgi:hypothetical protein